MKQNSLVAIGQNSSRISLTLNDDLEFDDWQGIGEQLKYIEGSVSWWIGDWLNYGERAYGEMYSQAISEAQVKTWQNIKFIAAAVESSRRREVLSFTHHAEVASLEPQDQDRLLDNAITNGWTARQLRETVRAFRFHLEDHDLPDIDGVFDVISLDPGWPYGTQYDAQGRRAASPYPEMSLEEIEHIQIPAADDCVLWLWTTHKFLRYSFELLDVWQFRDVAILTWVKDRMGLGQWLRSRTEFCIMAVKGNPMVTLTNQTTVLHGKAREHSRKPDEFYDMVDVLCAGKKIDYFSREKREGWEQFGNETDKFK